MLRERAPRQSPSIYGVPLSRYFQTPTLQCLRHRFVTSQATPVLIDCRTKKDHTHQDPLYSRLQHNLSIRLQSSFGLLHKCYLVPSLRECSHCCAWRAQRKKWRSTSFDFPMRAHAPSEISVRVRQSHVMASRSRCYAFTCRKASLHYKHKDSRHNPPTMGDTTTPRSASQRPTVAFDGFEESENGGWHWVSFNFPAIEPQTASHEVEHSTRASPGWSAEHDFERRLNRNGIKISEASDINASKATVQPAVQQRGGAFSILDGYTRANAHRANHYVSRSETFLPLETATMASFTNDKKETKVEALERQLHQAQTEAQVWKRQSERREQDLRASCKETMEWRMKYEDLYSAVLQGVDIKPDRTPKRVATKSLG